MFNKIASLIDKVADSLERKGLKESALELDRISDALDRASSDYIPRHEGYKGGEKFESLSTTLSLFPEKGSPNHNRKLEEIKKELKSYYGDTQGETFFNIALAAHNDEDGTKHQPLWDKEKLKAIKSKGQVQPLDNSMFITPKTPETKIDNSAFIKNAKLRLQKIAMDLYNSNNFKEALEIREILKHISL